MNLRFQAAVSLLVTGLIAWGTHAEAEATQPVPAAIVLNGITTILGDSRACFRVIFTGGLREEDFMLAEGQARYGIQLLAVDTKLNAVIISNQGLKRTVPICKTPTLLAGAVSGVGAGATTKAGADNFVTIASGTTQTPGNETRSEDAQSAHPVSAAGASGGQPGSSQPDASSNNHDTSGNSTSGANDSGAGASANAHNANDNATQDYHWWAKEAQKIEQARQATAQQVMDGTLQPFPMTPFTPPGTPAQLVGPSKMYFYYDPLAAND